MVLLVSNGPGALKGRQARTPGQGFAAVPELKGGHDVFGPSDPVANWPKPLGESLPDHQAWTWSQSTDVFPESPDRVFVTQKGELPVLPAGARGPPGFRKSAEHRSRPRPRRPANKQNDQCHTEQQQSHG